MKTGFLTALLVFSQMACAGVVYAQGPALQSKPMTRAQELADLQAAANRHNAGMYEGFGAAAGFLGLGFGTRIASNHYLFKRIDSFLLETPLSAEELERLGAIANVLRKVSNVSAIGFIASTGYMAWSGTKADHDQKKINDAKVAEEKLIRPEAPGAFGTASDQLVRPSAVAIQVR